METRRPPDFPLEVAADRRNVKDVVRGILHTIFFHRLFTALLPATHDVLDITLPYISTEGIDTLITARTETLVRSLASASHGQLVVQFLEKKRRKGWFVAKAEEETIWETWVLNVTLLNARNDVVGEDGERRVRRVMEASLQKAAMNVMEVVNRERGHIPPITTNESNPFPYQILVNPKDGGFFR